MRLKRPPRLRTILLLSNLAVLALPVAGLWALRLYESALVRQTESELIAQAAVLAGIYREDLHIPSDAGTPGTPAQPAPAAQQMVSRQGLDLARDPILPAEPDDQPGRPADPAALAVGRALMPVLRDAQVVTLASLRLTDRNGVIVATTGADLGRSLAAWPEVARVLAGEPLVSTIHRRNPNETVAGLFARSSGFRVFVAMPVTDETGAAIGAVVLSRTPRSLGETIRGKRNALAGLIVVLVAGGAGLAVAISRLVTRPLGIVVAQAQAAASGGGMTELPHPGTREVAELSRAIARMATTLEKRADYIKGFAASVSHEFKTPMAAIRAAGELLEDHDASLSAAERTHLLKLVSDGVARLERLVRRLVELARADMMGPGTGTLPRPVADRVAGRYRERGMTVTVTGEAGPVALSEEGLDALLTSLMDNTAVHAPGASARIGIARVADEIRITVGDDGPGIPASHRARVFEPFFTTARDGGGTGLGLPIVRAIASSSGGDATLLPTETGTAFLIILPNAAVPSGLNSDLDQAITTAIGSARATRP